MTSPTHARSPTWKNPRELISTPREKPAVPSGLPSVHLYGDDIKAVVFVVANLGCVVT